MPENNSSMPKTRRSLFYLATYLFVTGLAFLLAPQTALQLLLANHPYSDVFVQFTGVMMVGLSIVVANVIRIADPRFYGVTLMARIPMWLMILGIYLRSGEQALLIVLGVLGLGIVITGSCYLSERGKAGIS